jgi:hypothetical protein
MKMRSVAVAVLAVAAAAFAARGADSSAPPKPSLDGYRGFAFAVPGSQLAFLSEGDRVDVMVTFEASFPEAPKEKTTATILQNCLVKGVRRADKPGENGVLELVVNPNEGQYLALSLQEGVVQIMRRFDGDRKMEPMEIASFRKLFK